MNQEVKIIIAEDDEGHSNLIKKNLIRAGIKNEIIQIYDGQNVMDYFFNDKNSKPAGYLLLLDIKMPKVDGIEVLKKIKKHPVFKLMPVIMITTTEDPKEIEKCHKLGCNNYIKKPIKYEDFVEAIKQLGLFLLVITVPE